MPLTVNEARASFTLAGPDVEPDHWAWATAGPKERIAYYRRLGGLAIERLRYRLGRGEGADGRRLKPVRPASRRDGATGPPLSPHRVGSRFQKWLRAFGAVDRCTVYWSHGWASVARGHREGARHLPVRDVVGLKPADVLWAVERARAEWDKGHGMAPVRATPAIGARPRRTTPARATPPGPPPPPAPLPTKPKAAPAPVLPGRPIAERLAAYTDGDRKVDAIAALGAGTRTARRDYREANFRIENLPKRIEQATDPAEKARLRALYEASIRERDAAKVEIDRSIVEARAKLREIAGAASPQQWKHVGTGVDHPDVGPQIRASDDFLGPLMQTGATYPVQEAKWTVRKKAGYRANYDDRKRELNISKDDDVIVAIHERGHHIEDMFPEVGEQARRFLRYRVGDEPAKPMGDLGAGYDPDEVGRDDEFARYFGPRAGRYVGKHYPVGTEILSMGLQALYEDPIAFAQKDPEYAKWVLGILDGSLR